MNELKTFNALQYHRPDFEAMKEFYKTLNEKVNAAKSYEDVRECIQEEEEYSSHVNTMCVIAFIRHTIDTSDSFYEGEDEYINQTCPEVMPFVQAFNFALLNSPFKEDIDKEYGAQFLKSVKLASDSFCEKNIPLMQEESELTNRYQKLTASCKIPFDGEEHNLYGIMKYFSDPDREVRKEAAKRYAKFFEENDKELGEIFDRLVKIRHQMGVNMGFKNF
ncbi:MAG: M3 family oligoendopeptidase, partial [Clostridia bacterium]|nr:M3 family oligoendopeptidase [Clostridia bacterium]